MARSTSRREFIKQSMLASLSIGLTSGWLPGCGSREFDLIIRKGTVYDGLGGKPFFADIGILGERIASIGNLRGATAPQSIDADGLAVSPGFIDVHSHTDIGLLVNPKAESKIRQGVTTEISGQCGGSAFPLIGEQGERYRKNIKQSFEVDVDWSDAAGFLNRLEQEGIALNHVTFVGHSTVRAAVMGMENRSATAGELQSMVNLIREALDQGCFGLSTGLEYTPGSFADTQELIALCHAVTENGGMHASHIRGEDIRLEEAIEEALQISRETGIPLQISHLKASQKRNWHKMDRVLERLTRADEEGIRVTADRYTYTAWSTTMQILFPLWSREGETDDFINRLKDRTQWKRIRAFLEDKINALGSWESVLISGISSDERKSYQGKTVMTLANAANKDPYLFVRELLIQENGDVSIVGFAMSPENTEKVLAFPLTMVGSDGNALAPYGLMGRGNPHPRSYGTFPRYLGHYIRERKILTLAEAVRRITHMPAEKFSLEGRGILKRNAYADIVVFNPETVIDTATFTDPHQYPEGIEHVIVNGGIVIENGEHTGRLPGKALRRA